MVAPSPAQSLQSFEEVVENLPSESQSTVKAAAANLISSLVPVIAGVPEGVRQQVLDELSNLVFALASQGDYQLRSVEGGNAPLDFQIETVVNQLRTGTKH